MRDKERGFEDDGRTVVPMDVEGIDRPNPFGMGFSRRTKRAEKTTVAKTDLKLTKGEQSAIRKAAFMLAVQVCLISGAIFLGIFLFIRFVWLRGW